MSDQMKPLLAKAMAEPLSAVEARTAFTLLFEGEATDAQIGALLMALRMRGETVDEVAAATAVMREKCRAVVAPDGAMDIVGTGGDGKGTLNISTATAFVVAGAGVPVAKHGNRNLSSKSGAADALGQMGVEVMVGVEVVERALSEAGIGFMMAPMHHPAIAHVMPARQQMGLRTLFNLLGPLTNPAGVKRQLTGAYDPGVLRLMAEVLGALGSEAAWLVHGSDGTDELSIAGPSKVVELQHGAIREFDIAPEDAGLPVHPFEAILGGDPEANGRAFAALLDGQRGAYRDAVLLNAAAALLVAGKASDLKEGAVMAADSIDSGAAKDRLMPPGPGDICRRLSLSEAPGRDRAGQPQEGRATPKSMQHRIPPGALVGLVALLSGVTILVIDWLTVLDQPGEQIRESVVSDIGGAALVVTGLVILAVLWFQRGDAGRFQREGVLADGVVEDVRLSFFGTDVTVRFEDHSGETHVVTLRGSNLAMRPGFGPGTTVMLRYDPENPARLRFQETLDTLAPRP